MNLKQIPQEVLQVRAEVRGEANLGENREGLVKARRDVRDFNSSRKMNAWFDTWSTCAQLKTPLQVYRVMKGVVIIS